MPLVAGVDSSTQSVKVCVHDTDTGELVREASAPHPDGTECPPEAWWAALQQAGSGLLDGVAAVSVAGQQHGLVALDASDLPVRPALLWNDTRSADAAADLVAELGAQTWADAVGSVPVASFTVTKLRWMRDHEPDLAERVSSVLLPHDFLTLRLCGRRVTDRGDASGTGYWSPATGEYRHDLLRLAFGRDVEVPAVLGPAEAAGETAAGMLVGPGTGDNMGAALGLGLAPGDVVVSLGTSGTAFAVSDRPSADASGDVAGFADAAGRFLPLVCTLNASRVLTATAAMLGLGLDEFAGLALAAAPGAGGLVLLPYLDGERTPNLPLASGSLLGITRENLTPQNVARAAVEGMLCGLADAVDALRRSGVAPRRLLLIGGAAASSAVRQISPTVFDVPVVVPQAGQYVARGAALQAAWALAGGPQPEWPVGSALAYDPSPLPQVREAYSAARVSLYG